MKQRIQWKPLLICLAIPLAAGGLSALITKNGMEAFAALRQPPLSPPGWVFPVVWTILYVLMGLACYRFRADAVSVRLYAGQLLLNFLWPVLFFTLGLYFVSFLWLIVLWVMILVCTVLFHYISRTAGKLMLPYLIWTAFAGYLNLGIWLLNR